MKIREIATLAGVPADGVIPNEAVEVSRVASHEDAGVDAVVFASDEKTLATALTSGAGVVLGPLKAETSDVRVIRCAQPKLVFARIAKVLAPKVEARIHPAVFVDADARLGAGVSVGPGAVIEAAVVIGDDTVIGPNVTVYAGTVIGARCVVQAGAVLGSAGFGYVRDAKTGEYELFPQQGRLVLEDDVEIGANTTIDRGALGETRIGKGTKIDNLVQVGHNCHIGRNVVIASQVGISGSTVVEDGAVLAGQVGLGDHVRVGPGVILGGQSGVYPGKTVTGPGEMFAGTPAEPAREFLKGLARVRRLK